MKITFYGNPDIGKTSIILRYVRGDFLKYLEPTIGACFYKKTKDNVNLWDTSGTPRYSGITQSIGRGSDVIIYVFALDSLESFNSIPAFLALTLPGNPGALKILVGNKVDLCRVVEYDTAKQFANDINADYIEVSAKTGSGIQELFSGAVTKFQETRPETQTDTDLFIDLPDLPEKRHWCIFL